MKNSAEDTIYGWSQDTAFSFQSLRRLTDVVYPTIITDTIITIDTVFDSNDSVVSIIMDTVIQQDTTWKFFNNFVIDPNGYLYTLDAQKKPHPSSNSNTIKIPIQNKPVRSKYYVKWFDPESGLEYNFGSYHTVQQDSEGQKFIAISFPSSIRNLEMNTINNTFGDVVFALYYDQQQPNYETKEQP